MPEARLEFTENGLCRAYFAKFSWLMGLVHDIASKEAPGSAGGTLGELETEMVEDYLKRLAGSFEALSVKYLLTGLVHNKLPANLEIDQTDSGFPVFREMMALGEDGKQAQARLLDLPDRVTLKSDMIDHIAYVADLVGIDHVAIGSDFFESESPVRFHAFFRVRYPEVFGNYRLDNVYFDDFRRVEHFPALTVALLDRGFSGEDVHKILGGNFLRVFDRVWG